MKIKILILSALIVVSCKKEEKTATEKTAISAKDTVQIAPEKENSKSDSDTIVLSSKHKKNKMVCDLDGDGKNETVEIVRSTNNDKSGLRIIFGNGKRTDYLGMGNVVLKQGFDEIDWAGIFEKAPKNEIYWNNVSDDGEIMGDEEIKEEDKIKLPNDGIFIHAEESCGGGIIYLKNNKYEWIQQE
ncbi:hypothetical protein B0A67_14955 [Flavobacterium aquidurense]|jgi:hypothetical protein|uniref:hypothetical protein n=1 Tax=Flavobacterium aquidurense TaxID=362413 RepID=UPI00091D0DF2|nr:hypothetical protein [Flavobacterium aquidurense]OXA70527.1 hypothetical protein B0A67_14955 [Flavobacterium aquidurense]SHG33065.1 hypothetical protein SAMN05444481_103395 [Flavobacterium frigidimaris]